MAIKERAPSDTSTLASIPIENYLGVSCSDRVAVVAASDLADDTIFALGFG